ncbi:MAG: histidine phosphatase family protein [Actinomycetota bacterium]|nr:hypothetical protein [Acidimicrobiaceae bacterium]MEC7916357.1 histidine phosphatase family protein [Actinomycetota bacterium]MEC9058786.1 histidine phosphatase family protein [Actinomycetota bacterium]MED5361348.1 histidine phosphatase family protein [Actinomycetota bacterium]MEE3256597.1 histidine phosphatase family protein [Actinomycetota bacterium]
MPNTAPTPNTTRFILIRHGESNVMVDGVVGGPKTCSGLSPKGRRQAELLGKRFEVGNEPSFDVVYSSPLPRALETTHILLGTNPLDLEINIHPDLEEFRLGEADGLTWDQVRESYDLDNFEQRDPFVPIIPGSDSRAGFRHRVGEALSRIASSNNGSTVLIGCHGGVISAAMAIAFGLGPGQWHTELAPHVTSITELEVRSDPSRGRRWICMRYNDTAHLHGSEVDPREHQ